MHVDTVARLFLTPIVVLAIAGCSASPPIVIADPSQVQNVEFREANLRGANLEGALLIKRKMMRVNLSKANLHGADMREADLSLANLRGADLSEADLRWANLTRANLREANLEGAIFFGDDSMGNYGANLRRADLRKAKLGGADLRGVTFAGADLRYADFRGADMRGADLGNADLTWAKLGKADLRGARYNVDTKFPTSFRPQERGMTTRMGRGDFMEGFIRRPGDVRSSARTMGHLAERGSPYRGSSDSREPRRRPPVTSYRESREAAGRWSLTHVANANGKRTFADGRS
jgi:hypothetical protein